MEQFRLTRAGQFKAENLPKDFPNPSSSTPDLSHPASQVEQPSEAPILDSGYTSQATTPQSGSSESAKIRLGRAITQVLARRGYRRVSDLKRFDKPIPQATLDRFNDLREIFDESLYKYLENSGLKFTPISIKLKVLGENEKSARPWIVVSCDKPASRRVRQYFRLTHIREQYQPSSDQVFPTFNLVVDDRPPLPLSAAADVCAWGNVSTSVTLCGSAIKASGEGEMATATVGGVILITSENGTVSLYLMTVSHFLDVTSITDAQDEVSLDGDHAEDEDYDDKTDDEVFTLELGRDSDDTPSVVDRPKREVFSQCTGQTLWPKIGHVFKRSKDTMGGDAELDWALIRLNEHSLYKPNMIWNPVTCQPKGELIQIMDRPKFDRSVLILSGTGGFKTGRLSPVFASLMMSSGKAFTTAYTVEFCDDTRKQF